MHKRNVPSRVGSPARKRGKQPGQSARAARRSEPFEPVRSPLGPTGAATVNADPADQGQHAVGEAHEERAAGAAAVEMEGVEQEEEEEEDEDEQNFGEEEDQDDEDFDNTAEDYEGAEHTAPLGWERRTSARRVASASASAGSLSERDLARREANIAALQNNSIVTERAPVMDMLNVPKVLRPFIPPRGVRRTAQSDILLRKKTLGVRPRSRGYFPGRTQLQLQQAAVAEAPMEPAVPEHEPLVLWSPPPGSPQHWKPVVVDPIMCHRLRPHQREGVQFTFDCVAGLKPFDGCGCILADDMGLGKTFQSITLIWTLLKQGLPSSVEGSGWRKVKAAADTVTQETRSAANNEAAAQQPALETDASAKDGVATAPEGPHSDEDKSASEAQEPMVKKVIVACPTSLIGNWDNEINKWLPGGRIRTCPLEPGPNARSDIEGFLGNWNMAPQVLIVSYETYLRNYKKFIRPGACDLLICDEAHRLKNDATMTSRSLALLPTRRRMLLSGTPMQNDLTEFFAMVDFINPGVLRDVAYFRRHFERPILAGREPDASDTQQTRGEARSEELSTIVNEFILRRTNELLSAHLPPKLVQIVCCKLSTLQQLVYLHFVDVMDGGGSGTSTLGAILSLKKLCNHPKLVYDAINGYDQEASKAMACFKECVDIFPPCFSSGRGQRTDFAALIDFSGKFAVLDRLLFHLREHTKDRIVIVSNYTQTLDLMQALCRTRNYPCLRLDGSCSVSKRTKLVAALNDFGRDQFVFLLSSKAGGCGLNLVGANRLILFDPDWNPATDKQAAARVWRDGQKKKVYEYRFLASGSIEEKVFQRQLSKEGLATIVNNGTNETSSFSKDELRELFAVNPTVTSDTLNSFKQRELEDAGDLDSEDAGGSGTATKSDPPKNPLSINPHDECDGYKPQHGQPEEAQLLLHGHHFPQAFHTINDTALRQAVGDDVSFIFSREVDGCDLSKFSA